MGVMWRLVFIVALLCWTSEARVSCKDENRGDVDWFILYKRPNSVEFYYMTSDRRTALKDIAHQSSVLAHTLQPYFDTNGGTKDKGYIVYSDQPPTCKAPDKYGHSKGLLMMDKDKDTGVWLLHSTPKFPYKKESNSFYPESGDRNAQTFICVTFKYDAFTKLAQHLQQINAFIFDRHIPQDFQADFPGAPPAPDLHEDLKSAGGTTFRRFVKKLLDNKKTDKKAHAKNAEDGDLYVTIAEQLQSAVYAQTWGCQRGEQSPSFCTETGRHVYNVLTVDIEKKTKTDWKRTQDHSKWCVSKDKPWTCFADSNRSFSQYKRPGGALCIEHEGVANLFRGFIQTYEGCDGPSFAGTSSDDSDCDSDSDSDSDPDCPAPMDTD